jgi:hypothetical protein
MSRLAELARMPAEDWRLLVSALGVVALVRLRLWLLPYRSFRRVYALQPDVPVTGRSADAATALRIARAVRRASRLIPGASCLPQSVAAQRLLLRRGYSSTLRISAGRELGRFTAHAWLETDRGMLIGDESVAALLPLSRQLVIDD